MNSVAHILMTEIYLIHAKQGKYVDPKYKEIVARVLRERKEAEALSLQTSATYSMMPDGTLKPC